MVVTQSRVGQSTQGPTLKAGQSRVNQSTIGPNGRGITPQFSGGGSKKEEEKKQNVPVEVVNPTQIKTNPINRQTGQAQSRTFSETARAREIIRQNNAQSIPSGNFSGTIQESQSGKQQGVSILLKGETIAKVNAQGEAKFTGSKQGTYKVETAKESIKVVAPTSKKEGSIETTQKAQVTQEPQNNNVESQNVVSAYQEPKGLLASNIYRYNRETEQYETDVIRGETKTVIEKIEYGKDLLKLGANQGVAGVVGGINLLFALSRNTSETIQAIKEQIKIQTPAIDFGTTLSVNPTRAILSSVGNVAVTYGTGKIISSGLGSLGKIETALGYPKYVTTFKATQLTGTDEGATILGRALTERKGLLSNRVYASMFYSDIRNFGQNQLGATRFIGGSGAVTRERTMLLGYPNKFKYGDLVQSGSIVRGISKELPQVEGAFIFRGSAKSYGQAKGVSAFAGVGVEEATKITTAVKDVPIINGKPTQSGLGYTIGVIEKVDREALNNIIKQGSGDTVLKKVSGGTSSVTIGQAKPLIEANIKALEKADVIKTTEILSKVSLTTNTILSSTRVLPSVSAYAGQGTYEKTNTIAYSNPIIANSNIPNQVSSLSVTLNIIPKRNVSVISRSENRSNSRSRQEQTPLQETKQINQFRQGTEQRTNQQTIQAQLQAQRTMQKQGNSSGMFIKPMAFVAPKVFIPVNDKRLKKDKSKSYVSGYAPYIIVKGKKKYLGGVFDLNKALEVGAKEVIKDVSATFGADPTNQKVEKSTSGFRPNPNLFRDYRIIQGKKSPLINEYITRQGKRLNFSSEVRDLLSYKKKGGK